MSIKDQEQRLSGRRGVAFRKRFRSHHPLCAECERKGRVSEAVEIDHIIPLSKGGTNDPSNLQGLCLDHHQQKTARDKGYKKVRRRIGADGWPIED